MNYSTKTDGGPRSGPSPPMRVILAGGGHAHLAVLEDWIRRPIEGIERTLITPSSTMIYSGMLPGWIEGHYQLSDFLIDLKALTLAANVSLILDEIVEMNADEQRVCLASGETFEYDLVSLAIGGELDLAPFDCFSNILPVRPIHRFADGWEEFRKMHAEGGLSHIAVVGGGAAGVELAFAIAAYMARDARRARLSLVAGHDGLLSGHAPSVRIRAAKLLQQHEIEVFEASARTKPEGTLVLSDTSILQADALVLATGSRPPTWLSRSGLELGESGGVSITDALCSISHPNVYAAGDISERLDRSLPRSGVHAVKSGPVLAANLRAALLGETMRSYRPPSKNLYLLSTGRRRAILSWGSLSAHGAWVWYLKDWIDTGFVHRFQRAPLAQSHDGGLLSLVRAMTSRLVVRTAARVAFVVGTFLVAFNQGNEFFSDGPVSWGRIALNYLVPFLVASFSAACARTVLERGDRNDARRLRRSTSARYNKRGSEH